MMLRLQRERMSERRLRAEHEGIFPLFRPRSGKALLGEAGRARHASRADEPRAEIDALIADGRNR